MKFIFTVLFLGVFTIVPCTYALDGDRGGDDHRIRASEKESPDERCVICHDGGEDLERCEIDKTTFHADCKKDHGGCPTCGGNREQQSEVSAPIIERDNIAQFHIKDAIERRFRAELSEVYRQVMGNEPPPTSGFAKESVLFKCLNRLIWEVKEPSELEIVNSELRAEWVIEDLLKKVPSSANVSWSFYWNVFFRLLFTPQMVNHPSWLKWFRVCLKRAPYNTNLQYLFNSNVGEEIKNLFSGVSSPIPVSEIVIQWAKLDRRLKRDIKNEYELSVFSGFSIILSVLSLATGMSSLGPNSMFHLVFAAVAGIFTFIPTKYVIKGAHKDFQVPKLLDPIADQKLLITHPGFLKVLGAIASGKVGRVSKEQREKIKVLKEQFIVEFTDKYFLALSKRDQAEWLTALFEVGSVLDLDWMAMELSLKVPQKSFPGLQGPKGFWTLARSVQWPFTYESRVELLNSEECYLHLRAL